MCTQVAYSPSSYILDSTRLVFPCLSSQTVSQSQSSKACQTSRLCSGEHAARLLSTVLSVCTSAWPPVLALTLERKDTCGLQMPAHTQGPLHFFCSVGKQRKEKWLDYSSTLTHLWGKQCWRWFWATHTLVCSSGVVHVDEDCEWRERWFKTCINETWALCSVSVICSMTVW